MENAPSHHTTRSLTFSHALLVALYVGMSGTALAQPREYEVRDDGGSRVQLTSDAPLETMTGVTSHVRGRMRFDPADLRSATGAIEVQAGTFRTGIDLRDEHLRSETWLDATRHPTMRFELTRVEGEDELEVGEETRVVQRGRLTLHGRTRDVRANARVTLLHGAGGATTVRLRARFVISLSDYGITIGEVVRLKVADRIAIDVSIRALPVS